MPSAANLTPESRFMALFVGPKHSGKTVAACSWLSPAPSQKRMKVLDGDGRIRGILGAPWVYKDRIDYDYYPPEVAGNKSFFDRVNVDLDAMLALINMNQCPYETYVGDSLTSFCKNLILDALPLTHSGNKGKKIGTMEMAGPADYGFESTGSDAYLSFLRSIPLNVICTAHVVDKFDKPLDAQGNKDPYAESIKVGEKLSLRDKIGQNVSIYFDHIFRFDRQMVNREERFFVEYISDIACTSFPGLKPGRHDITGKNFREYTLELVAKASQQQVVK